MDAATGRVVGIARRQFAEESLDHSFTLGYAFSNFGTVNGLVFPYRIEKSINRGGSRNDRRELD